MKSKHSKSGTYICCFTILHNIIWTLQPHFNLNFWLNHKTFYLSAFQAREGLFETCSEIWRLDRRDSQLSNSFWSFELNHHICKMLLNVKTCLDLIKEKNPKKKETVLSGGKKIALTCKVWLHCGTVYVWPIRQIGKISNRNLASHMQKASLLCVVWKKKKNTTI